MFASQRFVPQSIALLLCLLCGWPAAGIAGEVRVAVASNFVTTLQQLAERFTARTGHRVVTSAASTGKHYAQIVNGAGFDVFLAADALRPRLLDEAGIGVPGSRATYAIGRLVLWVPDADALDDPRAFLSGPAVQRLAIANPRLAPYGLAAQQVLEAWDLWERWRPRLVRGENVAQAYQFVATGNAGAGLVALSQTRLAQGRARGVERLIDAGLHEPILQQGLLLRRRPAAEAFWAFIASPEARELIRAAGYETPGAR